jgi:hypothetical protein
LELVQYCRCRPARGEFQKALGCVLQLAMHYLFSPLSLLAAVPDLLQSTFKPAGGIRVFALRASFL